MHSEPVSRFNLILMLALLVMVLSLIGNAAPLFGGSGDLTQEHSRDASLATPRASIAHQLELLKAGDAGRLRKCFTERLRSRISDELIQKNKEVASHYDFDDLVSSVELGEADGQKTAKIKMKDGRTLTTLLLIDGRWLADTIWFK